MYAIAEHTILYDIDQIAKWPTSLFLNGSLHCVENGFWIRLKWCDRPAPPTTDQTIGRIKLIINDCVDIVIIFCGNVKNIAVLIYGSSIVKSTTTVC